MSKNPFTEYSKHYRHRHPMKAKKYRYKSDARTYIRHYATGHDIHDLISFSRERLAQMNANQ